VIIQVLNVMNFFKIQFMANLKIKKIAKTKIRIQDNY